MTGVQTCALPISKDLVIELAYSHAQRAWESEGEMIQVERLATYCNYLKKKSSLKKKI